MTVKIQLKHTGSLSRHGYHLKDPGAGTRRRALSKAIDEYGTAYVIHKLGVLATYRKNPGGNARKRTQRARALANVAWIQRKRDAMAPARRAANLAIYRRRRAKLEPLTGIMKKRSKAPRRRRR
jgi:hypothetical protein